MPIIACLFWYGASRGAVRPRVRPYPALSPGSRTIEIDLVVDAPVRQVAPVVGYYRTVHHLEDSILCESCGR